MRSTFAFAFLLLSQTASAGELLSSPILCDDSSREYNATTAYIALSQDAGGRYHFRLYGGPAAESENGTRHRYDVMNVSFGQKYLRRLELEMIPDENGLHKAHFSFNAEKEDTSTTVDNMTCATYPGKRIAIVNGRFKNPGNAAELAVLARAECNGGVTPIGSAVSLYRPIFSPDDVGFYVSKQAFECE